MIVSLDIKDMYPQCRFKAVKAAIRHFSRQLLSVQSAETLVEAFPDVRQRAVGGLGAELQGIDDGDDAAALDELERQDKQTALITMCTGGGMGTATIIERM